MISISRLAVELYEILSAPEYGYTLRLYDESSTTVITPTKARWIYLDPDDLLIRLPVDGESAISSEDTEIFFWKNEDSDPDKILQLSKAIRTVCNLFGVGFTIKDFRRDQMKKKFVELSNKDNEERQDVEESFGLELIDRESGEIQAFDDEIENIQAFDDEGEDLYVPEEGEYVRVAQHMIRGGHPVVVDEIYYDRLGEPSNVFVRFADGRTGNYFIGDVEQDETAENDFMAEEEHGYENDQDEYGYNRDDYIEEDHTPNDVYLEVDGDLAFQRVEDLMTLYPEDVFWHENGEWIVASNPEWASRISDVVLSSGGEAREVEEDDLVLQESLTGTNKKSFFALENARLVIVHETMIDETKKGSRSRNIKEMYVESKGERIRLPENYVLGGKALTRHLNEGGTVMDKTGRKIMETIKEAGVLRSFLREFKTIPQHIIETTRNRYQTIRENCGRLSGKKGYHRVKEEFTKSRRIDQSKIQEMKNILISELGLNESEQVHEAFDYIAKEMVAENVVPIKNVVQVLAHLYGDRDKDRINFEALAKELVMKRVNSRLSTDEKKEMGFMKGVGVKKLWAEYKGEAAKHFDHIVSGISNDFLSMIFNTVTDKIVHGEGVKKYELVIANMIKDGVLGNVQETMVNESMNDLKSFIDDLISKDIRLIETADPHGGYMISPYNDEPSEEEQDAAYDYLKDLVLDAVANFDPDEHELDMFDEQDREAAIELIVDAIYNDVQSEYQDIFSWEDMEKLVDEVLQ